MTKNTSLKFLKNATHIKHLAFAFYGKAKSKFYLLCFLLSLQSKIELLFALCFKANFCVLLCFVLFGKAKIQMLLPIGV